MNEKLIEKVVTHLEAAEMRQGCTNYEPHAEALLKEIIPIIQEETRETLRQAVGLIKSWHNMGARELMGKEQAEKMWNIYYNKSPEMKKIRDSLREVGNE